MKTARQFTSAVLVSTLALTLIMATSAFAQTHRSSGFAGPKANTGFVTMTRQNGKMVLSLSDDFVVPDTPDPHWRVVDSNGNVYELDKLKKKAFIGDKYQKEIVLP